MEADYVIQSVVFKQPKFTVAEAKKWLKANDYSGRNVDRTANMLRFRQMMPKKVERYGFTEYRTKELGRSGISLVIAYKKSIEGGSLSNTFRNIWNRIRGRHQAVVVPVADVELPPPPQVPVGFAPSNAEVAEAVPITEPEPPRTIAEIEPDEVERYYTPLARKLFKTSQDAVRKAEAELRDAERWRDWTGDISMGGVSSNFGIDRVYRAELRLEEARNQLERLEMMLPYLPLSNRPIDGYRVFDRRRASFFPFPPDGVDIQQQGGVQADVFTDADLASQMDANTPSDRMGQAPIDEKPPPYDLSTFGDREAERLAEAERVYNETMREEIEKQGMSEQDQPRGNGIYMKGFGRMMGGRMKRKLENFLGDEEEPPDPAIEPDPEDDEEEDDDEDDDVEEYNAYVDLIIEDIKDVENYLWSDLNRIDAGVLVVPNKEATTQRIFSKIDNFDRIKAELVEIMDENQTMEVAELVKDYLMEYIELNRPYVDIPDWNGGVFLAYI